MLMSKPGRHSKAAPKTAPKSEPTPEIKAKAPKPAGRVKTPDTSAPVRAVRPSAKAVEEPVLHKPVLPAEPAPAKLEPAPVKLERVQAPSPRPRGAMEPPLYSQAFPDASVSSPRAAAAAKRPAPRRRHPKSEPPKPANPALAIPFFLVLFMLAAVSFMIPLRPTESLSEKRDLAEFPEFSLGALLSGDYFDGITLWFSDTFPGRERWIGASTTLSNYHGLNDVTIYGQFGTSDDIPVGDSTPAPGAVETSDPEPDVTPQLTPPPAPEVVLTSPPEESVEHWGGIDNNADAEVVFGSVIQVDDAAYAYFGFSQYYSDRHANMVNHCADVMAEFDIDVYDILVPTSVGVLMSSDFQDQLGVADQGETISYIFSKENDNVKKVNIFNNLIEHNDEYLYFRTDHHWSALGAYYGYQQFCSVAGYEPAAISDFAEQNMGDFQGSFYSECKQSYRLRADTVIAFDPPGDLEMTITTDTGSTFTWPVLTDMSKSATNSKYMCFLGGDHPFTVIENRDLPDGPNCVVIKDSFGNPFVPFLTQNYSHVYVLDYRKYDAMQLRYFVQYYEVDDVLLVESLAMAQGDGTLDLMEWLTK